MSNEGFKFQASVKDADGDMVNVRADSEAELESNLLNFPVAAYAQFKANVRGGSALGQITAPVISTATGSPQVHQQQVPPPPQDNGWGAAPQQQAQQQQGGGGGRFGGTPHPQGKQCQCGKVLEVKQTGTGKTVYRCSDWRWNGGNPTTNHDSEWA